jgi:hypothetical protein
MEKINGDKTEGEVQLVCKDCYFAIRSPSNIVGRFIAECRRFPPQVVLIEASQRYPVVSWPVVSDDPKMFCFEFRQKEV